MIQGIGSTIAAKTIGSEVGVHLMYAHQYPNEFRHFYHSPQQVEMCGTDAGIVLVKVIETDRPLPTDYNQPEYLMWKPTEGSPGMIQPNLSLFSMQFTYGLEKAIEAGQGIAVCVDIEIIPHDEALIWEVDSRTVYQLGWNGEQRIWALLQGLYVPAPELKQVAARMAQAMTLIRGVPGHVLEGLALHGGLEKLIAEIQSIHAGRVYGYTALTYLTGVLEQQNANTPPDLRPDGEPTKKDSPVLVSSQEDLSGVSEATGNEGV